jgi:uncharacterized protein HemX
MTLNEFRQQMDSYRSSAEEEGRSLKDNYLTLERLHELYHRFDQNEQFMADQVIAQWALSDDEKLRFDALALIDDFRIGSAATTLQTLANRLSSSSAPGAPFERQKVERLLVKLAAMSNLSD